MPPACPCFAALPLRVRVPSDTKNKNPAAQRATGFLARQKGLEPPTLRTGIVPELTLVLREKRTIFAANQLKSLKIIETRYYFHIYSITPLPSPQVPLSKKKHGFYAIVRLSHDLF
jgi:hypothetical protein